MTVFVLGMVAAPLAKSEVPVVDDYQASKDSSFSQLQEPTFQDSAGQQPQIQEDQVPEIDAQTHKTSRPSQTSQASLDVANELQKLQQEVQELRGLIEIQAHELELLKKEQKTSNQGLQTPPATWVSKLSTKQFTQPTNNSSSSPNAMSVSKDDFLQQQGLYQTAYTQMKNKNYSQAITTMQSYLQKFPTGEYAANAHFWLGELFLLQNDATKSMSEFQKVLDQYPTNPKAQDAMLKIGFIYYQNGQMEQAKAHLMKVRQRYPNTSVAQLAKEKLQQMKEESSN